MNPIKQHGTEHTAKYLILLDSNSATRALLFGQDHRFLAEMFDEDGLVLGNLMSAGTSCQPPGDVVMPLLASAPTSIQCFVLTGSTTAEAASQEVGKVTSLTPGTGCNA
ncbi:MAG: hypothetical protein Tsb007_20070 [Rhizobacter sp.]